MTKDIQQALQEAFLLGQAYWQQADSDSYAQHRKSDVTMQEFIDLKNSFLENKNND
jgi:hypothetical protein